MKKVLLSIVLSFACVSAFAQFAVIRGVNPSSTFVNLNSDAQNNLAVNCVVGCGASAGTGGLSPDGSPPVGNPVLIAGQDGTNVQSLLTDTTGRAYVNVFSLPALPAGSNAIGSVTLGAGANAIGSVTVTGTPAVSISGTPAVTLTSTTLSGTTNAVISSPTSSTLVDKSGTITTGGTSQTLSAAKSRHYFFVQNLSSANLYINFTSAASAATGSILLVPNGSFVMEGTFISSELITIFGATTGQAFTAKDF